MTSSINTDTRVDIFAARENSICERKAVWVFEVSVLVPDLSSQGFTQERFGSWWENWEACEFRRRIKMGSDLYIWPIVLVAACIWVYVLGFAVSPQCKFLRLCYFFSWEVLNWSRILYVLLHFRPASWEWLGRTLCHWWLGLIWLALSRRTTGQFSW